MTTAREWAECD